MIATPEPQRKLGRARVTSGGQQANSFSLTLDAVAFRRQKFQYVTADTLHLLSACGPGSSVKAVAAILQSKHGRGSVEVEGLADMDYRFTLMLGAHGFSCHQTRLAYDTWHLLAFSKEPGLLPNFSQRSIYLQLRSSRYTTPILKHWTPWLDATLRERGKIGELVCFGNCQAGMMTATTADLDQAVMDGIQGGHLTLTDEAWEWPSATTE